MTIARNLERPRVRLVRLPIAAPTEARVIATVPQLPSLTYETMTTVAATAAGPDVLYWISDPTRIEKESW